VSRHQGKPSLNSRDPKNPLVYWFTHEGKKRSVDFGTLMTLAKQHAHKKSRPHLAEDFAQWCVVHNLERIEGGATKYGHLNNCSWLWSEYLEENFGAKSRSGPKWERATMTVSYDKPMPDGESGSFLDLVRADELSPEDRLLLKEELANRSSEEVEEALFNERAARKQNELLVYDYIVRLSANLGMAYYKPSYVAHDLKIPVIEVNKAMSRLVKRNVFSKVGKIVHLKTPVSTAPSGKRVA